MRVLDNIRNWTYSACVYIVPPVQPPAAGEGEECSPVQDLGADHGHSTHRAAATEAPREGEATAGVCQSWLCVCMHCTCVLFYIRNSEVRPTVQYCNIAVLNTPVYVHTCIVDTYMCSVCAYVGSTLGGLSKV